MRFAPVQRLNADCAKKSEGRRLTRGYRARRPVLRCEKLRKHEVATVEGGRISSFPICSPLSESQARRPGEGEHALPKRARWRAGTGRFKGATAQESFQSYRRRVSLPTMSGTVRNSVREAMVMRRRIIAWQLRKNFWTGCWPAATARRHSAIKAPTCSAHLPGPLCRRCAGSALCRRRGHATPCR